MRQTTNGEKRIESHFEISKIMADRRYDTADRQMPPSSHHSRQQQHRQQQQQQQQSRRGPGPNVIRCNLCRKPLMATVYVLACSCILCEGKR